MSFKVLVVPEDPKLNGHILKPLAERLLDDAGKPKAKVTVLSNPRVRGYEQAVEAVRGVVVERYGFFDLCLFFPDADRAVARAMQALEAELRCRGVSLLCCPARPEVEIFACAAFRDELPCTWEEARTHHRLKEEVFEPLRARQGFQRRAPGGGRKAMIERSLRKLALLFQLCPETRRLRDRIADHLG